MSQIEIVAPVTVDGIEFYVSQDGKQCGVSQIGLARLCGLAESTTRDLLEYLTNPMDSSARGKESTKLGKDLQGKDFYLAVSSIKGAKVVDSKVAARIIQYFAFEAKRTTESAKFSLGKFATMGIETWIKNVTGYAESGDIFKLLQSMSNQLNLVQSEIQDMKVQLIQTEGYRAARVTLPGLREWMESLEVADYERLTLPGTVEEELFTLNEWAIEAQNGLILSKSTKHALANLVSATYKTMTLEMPPKVIRLNEKGYKLPAVQAYPKRHFILLNMCFSKLVSN
jgi:hypothetical protein